MKADSTWNRNAATIELAVADLVHDEPADDDAEAETGEPGAADGAELRAGEAEFGGPVRQDAAADAEADARRENGQEAGPQQPLGVRCDGVGAYSRSAHGCPLSLWLTALWTVCPGSPGLS